MKSCSSKECKAIDPLGSLQEIDGPFSGFFYNAPMRSIFLVGTLCLGILVTSGSLQAQENPPLHGAALKEKEAELPILEGLPTRPYQKIAPVWASHISMESTMKDIRKQAAKIDADAVIDVRVKTEKLQNTQADPGFWGGPVGWDGWGPWGGVWGGASYWGGYATSHTYTQPVVSGWAVKWTGPDTGQGSTGTSVPSLPEKAEAAPAAD